MLRRDVLRLGVGGTAAVAAAWASGCAPVPEPPATSVFSSGVASGLHSSDAVVIWTRCDPRRSGPVNAVDWEVATDPGFGQVVAAGVAPVSPSTDHTVKVLVDGLDADRSHWYRFRAAGEDSPVGRARTAPAAGAAVSSLRLAVGSCQSYAGGWYTPWRQIAATDLDAVLFLGDYIYEAVAIQLLGTVRAEPTSTARTLDDYRARYRLYRSDPDLQAAHAAHPFATIWDDHEVTNDYDRTIFATDPQRVTDAYRAWFEYQPVWPVSGTRIHRDLGWGSLARLFLLDGRQYRDPGREGAAPLFGPAALTSYEADPSRTMLGSAQRSWLTSGLSAAAADGATWKVVGNPVMISPLRVLDLDTPATRAADPSLPKHAGLYTSGLDTWDGYPVERDLVLGHLADGGPGGAPITGTVFLTGDYHSFWASTLTSDFDDPNAPTVAHEFTCSAISSPGGASNERVLYGAGANMPADPAFDYVDLERQGWGLVEMTPDACTVTFMATDARSATRLPTPSARFTVEPGSPVMTTELLG
jgi:alkaline phosphatase D